MDQNYSELLKLTQRLLHYTAEIKTQYIDVAPFTSEVDFYGDVKPFVDEVTQDIEAWKPLALEWVANEKPMYIHPIQIEKTVENLLMVAVQCFYTKTRKTRFLNTVEAVVYVMANVENHLLKLY
ncbi:YppE family protein [Aureibacillus halotolerans]|uniref:Uncharacterized protein DUF1798 n=1 Tax=Aureibacillus halotolerans TaxID=1508390 RepID=A0A4V3D5U8_9BACI|nr:YppE family protein [Aureibacillus halotolerans]TDQ41487.1 uncharacterized protein DUF1798 [Aureibacillus halotolerans]